MANEEVQKKGQKRPKGSIDPAQVTASRTFPDEYGRVVSKAQLGTVQLIGAHFDLKPSYFSALKQEGGVSHRYDSEASAVHFDPTGTANAVLKWSLEVIDQTNTTVLAIECKYLIVYSDLEGCDKPAVELFVGKVGHFTVYPYFRAFVSQISWSSGTNLPILPVLTAKGPKSAPRPSDPSHPLPKHRTATRPPQD